MDTFGLIQLAELIYEYCGIDFSKSLSSLEAKISERLNELGLSCWEYGGYLRVEPKEWDMLIELITVNETYFFREENLLAEFQKTVLPQYKDRTPENPLRIWCSACSSGEEPYTLAIIAEETGLFQTGAVEIIASDINKKVLEKAISGSYNKKSFSFRTMPKEMLEKYFVSAEEEYVIRDSVRAMVDFRCINLMDKDIAERIGKVDIIFCRNVLIYFNKEAINKVINSLYDVLNDGGYLFLGHAETITGMNTGFETIYTPSAFYYRKGEKCT
ncbi:chemotaxis protein methyltransferase 2 [Thermoclostridium stercorarium subsp. stercorarium DSM 8532]|uniref:protein-glutamate O-methyltransferase n=1 Tax=Thermoclostridium stercorarium (strain ATCC 35414 / DSM 8532 / NCIMB 11754) TaxID=1121335 RepID=L7VT93_THES1|nr:protein-glutamate O-methyltransferase CheR [Thermoclostridium stercorarium]AGC68768.1 chemotaxis protein methyltransferase 2 [Thermoclostridium stercorarium subsp. stercorarium DSM 8532]AGI39774.1 methylase [Thermoclostridium stercorarium subsp. stercorarium DSM 8532]UZQ84736.1 protein-glutamate O-methyltransferase CheR [Thermoclostridium stercorarium]